MTVPDDLVRLRQAIDSIDSALMDLIVERLKVVEAVASVKEAHAIAVVLPDRIEEVVELARANARARGVPECLAEAVWRVLIAETIRYEQARVEAIVQTRSTGTSSGTPA